jgi:hypothetical protein
MVVQPYLADGYSSRVADRLLKRCPVGRRDLAGLVRVYAHGCENTRLHLRQFDSAAGIFGIRADGDDVRYACLPGALQHTINVADQGLRRQMGMRIDEPGRHGRPTSSKLS